MTDEIHVDDIGTQFEITIKDGDNLVNLSAATDMTIIFQKPDKITIEKIATLLTDGTDGRMKYSTIVGDLNIAGNWKIQAKVSLPAGVWKSDISEFKVYKNL